MEAQDSNVATGRREGRAGFAVGDAERLKTMVEVRQAGL